MHRAAAESDDDLPVLCQNQADWNRGLHHEIVTAMNSDTAAA